MFHVLLHFIIWRGALCASVFLWREVRGQHPAVGVLPLPGGLQGLNSGHQDW